MKGLYPMINLYCSPGDWSLTDATMGGCSASTESTGSTVASRVGKKALKADAIERKESDGTGGNKVKPDLTRG